MSLNVDVSSLLSSLGDDAPCGPNLEYDAEFLALEEAARSQPGQEFGNDGGGVLAIEGQGADWGEVRRLAEALFQRTRDLRVAVYYMRALLRTEGFGGLDAGLKLIHGLLETHWDHVHPQLDPDDDNDPTMRINSLAPLVASDALIDDLRASWLLRSRQSGVLTVRNIEVCQGRLSARDGEDVYSESQLAGMLTEAMAQDESFAASVQGALDLVKQLSSLLQDRVGASASIDLRPLQDIIFSVKRALPEGVAATDPEVGAEEGEGTSSGGGGGRAARPGEIASRQDVVTTLERLIQYLERTEPTNPASMLLRRARRVMDMNFLEAIQELAPDGVVQAEQRTGAQLGSGE
ncbi:type VI secretion system protein TssA [Viridibacterium curvum]|uniref:Type VI secretion system protein TssA n=1 Tax=Viridibacterium curvum TaxID=1101404 RepID=A0ABP9QUK2_9RHOO